MHGLHVFSKSCLKTRTSCIVYGGPDPQLLLSSVSYVWMIHFRSLFPSFNSRAARHWNTKSTISISVCSGCQHPQVAVHSSSFPTPGDIPIATPFLLTSICSLEAEVRHKAPMVAQGRERSLSCQAHPSVLALGQQAETSWILKAQLSHSVFPMRRQQNRLSHSWFTQKREENQAWKLNLHARLRKL